MEAPAGLGDQPTLERKPVSMSPSSTPLATSDAAGVRIRIELVEPVGKPARVRIVWPERPTLADPKHFPDIAAEAARLFARAHVVLASLRAGNGL